MDREIEIRIGEKRVAMNSFTKQIVLSTLMGLLQPLKHVETAEEIHIRIAASRRSE